MATVEGFLVTGVDEFGVCKCGLRLPEQVRRGQYGESMGRLLFAEDFDQLIKAIMGNVEHDVIEYFHRGNWAFSEHRVKGKCQPCGEYLLRHSDYLTGHDNPYKS
jgi:hypothetical protein